MSITTLTRCGLAGLLLLTLGVLGCDQDGGDPPKGTSTTPKQPQGKKIELGKNVSVEFLEGGKRRVLLNAYVCRRQDQLEQLLCRKQTKEHESILAFEGDARQAHAALMAAGAEPGNPVSFQPNYKPASGTRIKVLVQYKNKDKTVTVPAQQWIRHIKTKKDLEYEWIFAGSKLYPPFEPKAQPFYAANDGDVICISNFETAMLDLPVLLPNDNENLIYEAHTERIPAVGTPVTVILEPVLEKKK